MEDANSTSPFITEILERYRIKSAHLYALTPPKKKPNETDPNWKIARGIVQRNQALMWLRYFNFVQQRLLINVYTVPSPL